MRAHPVAQVFAAEWPRLVAALVRDLGDLDLAEDCAQEAFLEASRRWGPSSTPRRPGAWLLTTARRRAIDRIRREQRFTDRLQALHDVITAPAAPTTPLVDDRLALIFGCCHTSLDLEAQVALTLREVCGLSTGQIATSFVVRDETMAKRLVRAKAKIRAAGIPFSVPEVEHMAERLDAVLRVVYLIFTEGHTSTSGMTLLRGDLCDEARWLAGLLAELLPDEAEVHGLAALLCFTDARRSTRVDEHGELVLLGDQDRSRWDHDLITEGDRLLEAAIVMGAPGPYQLQAAIAGTHANAPTAEATDWTAIVRLYDRLVDLDPGPVIALNRAVAVAMAHGPAAGLRLLDILANDGRLDDFRYLHAARGDLLTRLDRPAEAGAAFARALELTTNEAEHAFLTRRIDQLAH